MAIEARWSGWRGVGLIAVTYVYFLIFAQFAFLQRLAMLGIADAHLKAVMAAMAAGGILFSLLTPRMKVWPEPRVRLAGGLAVCGAAALLTLLSLGLIASMGVSFLIGSGLGLVTVTLVTHLPLWLGNRSALVKVGLGTGIGYLVCNLPLLFTASPEGQAIVSAILCAAGMVLTVKVTVSLPAETARPEPGISFSRILICFTALVWLDSAAFFIIQNTPALKAGTWEGTFHLWGNGLLHLGAALASAWFLRRRGLSVTLTLAFLGLAVACLLLLDPGRAVLASLFYPVGVSLYSVALVAYPSLLAPASSAAQRGKQAGWIYAIAGWIGSAMGIGMGQNLGHVPPAFVLFAGALVVAPQVPEFLRRRKREVAVALAALVCALCAERIIGSVRVAARASTPVERGQQVYVAEGCIHCHSQYVRPNTRDVLWWGPVRTLEALRREHPPLIGNRRQGPDLANVGGRRSGLWLEAHLYNPAELSEASFMPSYAYLFQDGRGEDLVSYLQSLRSQDPLPAARRDWRLSTATIAEANPGDGGRLFRAYCATCHDEAGSTRRRWRSDFKTIPPGFATGPFAHISASQPASQREQSIAEIVKFGLYGTDMPGHEYLDDREIGSISVWLARRIAQPTRNP